MLSNLEQDALKWKKVTEDICVSQFTSKASSEKIYLKKITAKKIVKNSTTIFLFHDITSYHGRFLNLVEWFRQQAPEVNFIMMDFLGHGLSSGTRVHMKEFSQLTGDMAQLFGLIEKEKNQKWIALGHGVGALALLDLLNVFDENITKKIDGLIISNFILNFSSPAFSMQELLLQKMDSLDSFMKNIRPMSIYGAEEILSHNVTQVSYLEDPLILRNPTFSALKCVNIKAKNVYQDAYFLDKPTLLLQSQSPYVLTRGMDAFSKGFKKGLLIEKKYSNLKHDLYNEKNSLEVFNDIAQWIV